MPDIPMIDAKGQKVWVPTEFLEAALSQGFTQEPDATAMQSREYGLRPLEVASREQLAGLDPQSRYLAEHGGDPDVEFGTKGARFAKGTSTAIPQAVLSGMGIQSLIKAVGLKAALKFVTLGTMGTLGGAALGEPGGGAIGNFFGDRETGKKVGAFVGGAAGGLASTLGLWKPSSTSSLIKAVAKLAAPDVADIAPASAARKLTPYWQRPGFKSGGTPPIPYGKSYPSRPSSSASSGGVRESMLNKTTTPIIVSPEAGVAPSGLTPESFTSGAAVRATGGNKPGAVGMAREVQRRGIDDPRMNLQFMTGGNQFPPPPELTILEQQLATTTSAAKRVRIQELINKFHYALRRQRQ